METRFDLHCVARHSAEYHLEALARFLLCTIEGLGVLGKTGRSEKEVSQIVDEAMQALD